MELKTLKDIFEERAMYANDIISKIILDDLKEEAIRHIQGIQPVALLNIKNLKDYNTVEWIKYFFNISEEDLKGGLK